MKCLICKKEFSGDVCPRCKFPVVHFPGSMEDGVKTIEATIHAYRDSLLKSVEISVLSYYWKDLDGRLVLEEKRRSSFGTADRLFGKKIFLDEKFARVKDKTVLPIDVEVKIGEERQNMTIEVPNLPEAALQQIGIEFEEDFRFRLLLKNEADKAACSAWQSIF